MSWGRSLVANKAQFMSQLDAALKTVHHREGTRKNVSLFPEEVTAEGDHAEQDLNHLLHHVGLPPQIVLPLLAVSIHGDVEALVELRTQNDPISSDCLKHVNRPENKVEMVLLNSSPGNKYLNGKDLRGPKQVFGLDNCIMRCSRTKNGLIP